ncbi:MAG: arsenate reductase ArsC, partial [Thermoanaerobaculia bacterium]
MAEGWARHLKGELIKPSSAGVEAHGLDPRAIRVMLEAGVDISARRSKRLADLPELDFDWVVTVCDNARERCPVFPGEARLVHRSFEDPPRLAAEATSEGEALGHYRRVRDEIR